MMARSALVPRSAADQTQPLLGSACATRRAANALNWSSVIGTSAPPVDARAGSSSCARQTSPGARAIHPDRPRAACPLTRVIAEERVIGPRARTRWPRDASHARSAYGAVVLSARRRPARSSNKNRRTASTRFSRRSTTTNASVRRQCTGCRRNGPGTDDNDTTATGHPSRKAQGTAPSRPNSRQPATPRPEQKAFASPTTQPAAPAAPTSSNVS